MPIKELPLPPGVTRTPDADEILRVFINADKRMDLTLSRGFNDVATWGALLADVARNVARAYVALGDNEQQAFARIRQAFLDETAQPPGGAKS